MGFERTIHLHKHETRKQALKSIGLLYADCCCWVKKQIQMLFTNGELESYIISFFFFFFSLSENLSMAQNPFAYLCLSSFISGGRQ